MVSKAREDLPLPERPVTTTITSRGRETLTFFRLCSRAPRTTIRFSAIFGHPFSKVAFTKVYGPLWGGQVRNRFLEFYHSRLVVWAPESRWPMGSRPITFPGRSRIFGLSSKVIAPPSRLEFRS